MQDFRGRRASVVIALVACALLAATSTAAAPGVSTTTPVTYLGTNPCTGESFTGTGVVHMVMTENLSASGNLEYHLNSRVDGLTAVTVSGKKYVVQDTFNHDFTFNAASEDTFAIVAHFVRVGEDGTFILGDDFYEYLKAHITANANGMVTAFKVDTSDDPCQ
jgi:hypothetical protein